MQRKDAKGHPLPFSLKYRKKSTGEMVHYPQCVLTSFHAKGKTINVLPAGEVHPRKIRRILVMYYNDVLIIV